MKTFPPLHLNKMGVKGTAQLRKKRSFTIFSGLLGLILSCNPQTIMRSKAVPIFTFRATINLGVHWEESECNLISVRGLDWQGVLSEVKVQIHIFQHK
jgi:hypothetical protein